MARLEQDDEYQRRMAAYTAVVQQRARELRAAEQPIVAELCDAGVDVSSVWDLVSTSEPYPAALPVLLKHLQLGGYPDSVLESLGRALAVTPAVAAWDTLRDLYLNARGRGEEEGLAVALATSATSAQLDDLTDLLGQRSRSDTRLHFLSAIKRVGGQRGRDLIESLKSDPMFGEEAQALLNRG